jgi:O-methyltransferase domain
VPSLGRGRVDAGAGGGPGELYYQAAATGSCSGRRCGRPRGCGRCWWTSRRWWSRPAGGWRPRGVAGRCELVAGDFFGSVPAGADAYLRSRVRADDDARRVLATCRSAPGPGSRLLVVEALLPERARDQPAVIRMDLHMLVLLGARERTEAHYRRLLAETGFRVERVVPTASVAGVSVLEAVPAD